MMKNCHLYLLVAPAAAWQCRCVIVGGAVSAWAWLARQPRLGGELGPSCISRRRAASAGVVVVVLMATEAVVASCWASMKSMTIYASHGREPDSSAGTPTAGSLCFSTCSSAPIQLRPSAATVDGELLEDTTEERVPPPWCPTKQLV